jgi:hypothetical protein
MTDTPETEADGSPDDTFHPIDVRYAREVGLDELRRAFIVYAVAGIASQVSLTPDKIVPLCADLHAFLTGEPVAKLRAVK